jgi:hypothetical protein
MRQGFQLKLPALVSPAGTVVICPDVDIAPLPKGGVRFEADNLALYPVVAGLPGRSKLDLLSRSRRSGTHTHHDDHHAGPNGHLAADAGAFRLAPGIAAGFATLTG